MLDVTFLVRSALLLPYKIFKNSFDYSWLSRGCMPYEDVVDVYELVNHSERKCTTFENLSRDKHCIRLS